MFDLNSKLQEIRAMKATADEKSTLTNMVASEYANSYMVEAEKKEKSKNSFHWEDDDISAVFHDIKDAIGSKSTWEYGVFQTKKYDKTIADIAEKMNRTDGAIHSLLKIATINGNISKAKKKKGGIKSALRFKKIALSVGLINEKEFVGALYRGYDDGVLNLEEFISNINSETEATDETDIPKNWQELQDSDQVEQQEVDAEQDNRFMKVTTTKKRHRRSKRTNWSIRHYTFDERVSIFKKVVDTLGNYNDIELAYGQFSFSGFPPKDLNKFYANIASTVPHRTTSAVKNLVDHAVEVTRNTNDTHTKSKIENYSAAVEAGFIV